MKLSILILVALALSACAGRGEPARQEAAEAKVEALGLDAKARAVAQDAATARTRV